MATIRVKATETERTADEGQLHLVPSVPKGYTSRAQYICDTGIFNLMGIRGAGTYEIACTRIRDKRKR